MVFTNDYSTENGADVTESTLKQRSTTSVTTSAPVFTEPPEDQGNNFENEVDQDPAESADGSIVLISDGIRHDYYLYKEAKGFTSANRACEKLGMTLLLIEDEVQNARIAMLLLQEEVDRVWLGKFWLEDWVITLHDGTRLDFRNFEDDPGRTSAPIFATIRADGFWDAVNGRDRYFFVCQRSVDVEIDRDSNEVDIRKLDIKDDDGDIRGSIEESYDHPPTIVKGPVNVTAQVGDTVTFKCTASSKPPSTVIIVKIDDENQELPSIGDATQLNDESQRVTTIIELESVTRDDAGKYSCIAQNELGEASAPAWLIIEDLDSLALERPTCMFWGDPHITTYDDRMYNFPGVCTYILSMDCTSSNFWIYGLMKECGGGNNAGPSLSALDSVTIYARVSDGNQTGVELQRGWVVNIGGAKLRISEGMSARHGNLIIRRTSEHVFVTLPNMITVQWDGLQMAVIRLPAEFGHDRTCGLCGRYNNDPSDDFYMRYGHTDQTSNANVFGNSWAFPTHFRPCEMVPDEEINPCHDHPDRDSPGAILCHEHLYTVPFTQCHNNVDPQPYYDNCRRDFCGSEWRRDQNLPLCNALSAYATACEIGGRPISSWRSEDLCPIDEIKEITKEEGCPWDELEFDFEDGDGERDVIDSN